MQLSGDWSNPFLLEMKVANIISLQAKHGTQFNIQKSRFGIYVLSERIANIDKDLIPLLPSMMNKAKSEYKKPFKLNGDLMGYVQKYCDQVGLTRKEIGGPFTPVWYTPFDPSKSAKVKAVMLDMGWIPTEWNIKKQPLQMWTYRKKLERTSFNAFMEKCKPEDRAHFNSLLTPYLEKHFKDKSVGYKKAILTALDFDLDRKTPTFGEIKKRLLLRQFWPSSPKITEDSFESLDVESSRALYLLKERMIWSHRRSLLVGLNEHLRPDNKLSGECNPCATPTARGRHKIIVNIPAAGAPFGKVCRSLFTGDYNGVTKAMLCKGKNYCDAKLEAGKIRRKPGTNILQALNKKGEWEDDGYWNCYVPAGYDTFVGGDGAALELRMLAHYLVFVCKLRMQQCIDSGDMSRYSYFESGLKAAYDYREQILSGDIHTHNQALAGLPTRNAAKSFIYCYLYGGGNAKVGSLIGGDAADGAQIKETFLRECPCIPILVEWAQEIGGKEGWIPALDGRKLFLRKDPDSGDYMTHKALNLLLQSAGSIVMKYAMCFIDGWIKSSKIDCHQVIFYHDEYQFTCKAKDVDALRGFIDRSVGRAGEYLKMECPLASDSIAGPNWYFTH